MADKATPKTVVTEATIAKTIESTRNYENPATLWLKEAPQRWTWEDMANDQLFKLSLTPALDAEGRRLVDPHTNKLLTRADLMVVNAFYPNVARGCLEFATINKWDKVRKKAWAVSVGTIDGMDAELSFELTLRPPRQARIERDLGTTS